MGKRALLKESCYLSALTGTRQFTRGKQLNAQLHEELFGLRIFFLAHRVELKLEKNWDCYLMCLLKNSFPCF